MMQAMQHTEMKKEKTHKLLISTIKRNEKKNNQKTLNQASTVYGLA